MIKKIFLFFLLIFPSFIFAQNSQNFQSSQSENHKKIKELSDFTIIGTFDLRAEKKISSPIKYRSLNHEGGISLRVLEVLKKDVYENQNGLWLYVLLTKPIWAENGDWIEKYSKFLIFLPDETPIFDFVE